MKTTKTIILLLFISFFMSNTSAKAQIDPLLGQISMFAGNFAPRGWALCNGQLLAISSNSALFSIIGTTYGGDGRTTFALPDLRGRAPIHAGNGAGLTDRRLGSRSGTEQTTITVLNIPAHSHSASINVASSVGRGEGTSQPSNGYIAEGGSYSTTSDNDATLATGATTIGNTGGSQPINNMQPYLTINYIISLQGIFPSRN